MIAAGFTALAAVALSVGTASATAVASPGLPAASAAHSRTATPIKHLVVIFGENVSFDHYFGTYPVAANTDGTAFTAARTTPIPNNYLSHPSLLTANPNLANPARLGASQAVTCDQDHNYVDEQKAFDGGLMDQFVQHTNVENCAGSSAAGPIVTTPGLVMDYYDGNTVTGLWNYAQHYAMSDNSYGTTFGPSTPGALNLVSGQTHGGIALNPSTGAYQASSYAIQSPDPVTHIGTVTADPDPFYDDCSNSDHNPAKNANSTVAMTGTNIGDLLNAKHVTWGWFQGGFTPSTPATATTLAKCGGTTHSNIAGVTSVDYSPHHSPFQYYASTSNPHHLPPSSMGMIGRTDQANHQYDLSSFSAALSADNLPSVSFLKAAEYQDGHAGYSDPIDEQHFLVSTINAIESSPEWSSTAIVLAYDDSDGWYDHVASVIRHGSADTNVNQATDPALATSDQPLCLDGPRASAGYEDRCGPGPRLPFLVISPYTRPNTISHTPIEQASITRFIENNWGTGRIGDQSFDARAGSLSSLFDFGHPQRRTLLLNPDGSVQQSGSSR
ncbi:alkaline phosphatase family protein [Galbitalea soli]|uniref:Alkaline phosphatase family protein n=2 Tax=Galbitalea soli TaxID=1268042 RepID=A0A7C9TPY2_9MICO|nr:alkaline phosphatase family protein [Galbitalea soli]